MGLIPTSLEKVLSLAYRGSTVVVQRADNAEVAGPNPAPGTTMLENGFKMTASTESFAKMEKIDGFSRSRTTPACLEV